MDEFDYLVIGGGSSGCVVASRLSEDPGTSVALLEAGGMGASWVIKTPAAGILTVPTRLHNWAFKTEPQPGLNGRCGYQPRGKALGGSSAINAMVYTRGHRWDYDHWASLGNKGWSFDEVLPYFKKSECNEDFAGDWHGRDGPMNVAKSRTDNPFHQTFLQAAREAQFPLCADFNVPAPEGVGIYQVSQKNGERWSAARGYIHPHLGTRHNLLVECGARVRRILFEGKRAIGVEFLPRRAIAHVARAPRDHPECRRHPVAADSHALGRRRWRGAAALRDCGHRAPTGRRPQSAGSSRFRFWICRAQRRSSRLLVSRIRAPGARDLSLPRAPARNADEQLRRGRRIPEDTR